MKAVGYKEPGALDREDALVDIELAEPEAKGRDLLVRIHAVSVNPVDFKLRQTRPPESSEWAVLGFDASGVVEAVGSGRESLQARRRGVLRRFSDSSRYEQ